MAEAEWDFGAFERDLLKLSSISSALVEGDEAKGRVTAIHIVSDGTKEIRQLKRDVETLAKAEHKIPLDHRVISITERKGHIPVRMSGPVLELVSVGVTTHGSMAECKALVRKADSEASATHTGPASRAAVLVARATLDAASNLQLVAADVRDVHLLDAVTVVVLEFADEGNGTSIVAGASTGDDHRAVALATLDAVQRHE